MINLLTGYTYWVPDVTWRGPKAFGDERMNGTGMHQTSHLATEGSTILSRRRTSPER